MITLYGFARIQREYAGDTRDLRAQWMLEETGLPYQVKGLDPMHGEFESEAFGRINVFHQIPVIDDEGFVLTESAAILLYLAEKSGKLMPSDFEGRIRVTQWCFAALTTVEPVLVQLEMIDTEDYDKNVQEKRRSDLRKFAQRWLSGVEKRLEDREWVATSEFTVADLLLANVLFRSTRKTDLLDPFPRLQIFYRRATSREAWKRTVKLHAQRLGVLVEDVL